MHFIFLPNKIFEQEDELLFNAADTAHKKGSLAVILGVLGSIH